MSTAHLFFLDNTYIYIYMYIYIYNIGGLGELVRFIRPPVTGRIAENSCLLGMSLYGKARVGMQSCFIFLVFLFPDAFGGIFVLSCVNVSRRCPKVLVLSCVRLVLMAL